MGAGHPDFFATVTESRRGQLGLTMSAVHKAGGPSVPTLVQAEAGELDNPQAKTFAKFDAGLRWVPGSAARAYRDAEQPIPADEKRQPVAEPIQFGPDQVPIAVKQIVALMGIHEDLHAAAEGTDPVPAAELRPLVDRLSSELSVIVGAWTTELLERNRTEGGAHPQLAVVLAESLAPPVHADDPNREERLYRRWLAGGPAAEGIDEELCQKFDRRYRARLQGDANGHR